MTTKASEAKIEEVFPGVTELTDSTPTPHTKVKFIMRTVGEVGNLQAGIFSIEQVENYINSYLADGWQVHTFTVLESLTNGRRMSWLLVK